MKALTRSRAGWQAYTQSRTSESREQLLLGYLPLVRRIACRMLGTLPRSVRFDDLVSAGVTGLLSSLEHFDPTLGIKFETFAVNRIRGAMVDSLRELDWVPRSVRHKARLLERTMEELAQRLGRWPEDPEVADALHVSLDDYSKMLDDVNVAVLISLDDTLPNQRGDGTSLSDMATDLQTPSSQDKVEVDEVHQTLVHHVKSLPEQEKLVIALYYYEELTFKEIGAILNLTESRVSQIHSRAVLRLRSSLRGSLGR